MGRRKSDKAALSKLVDRSVFVENDASPLYDRILAFAKGAIGAASNVKPIDAGGLASLLPDLLPDAWGVAVADERFGGRRVVGVGGAVAWFPEPDGTSALSEEKDLEKKHLDHPTYDALAALWRLFVAKSPNTLAPFEGGLCSRWTKANDWRRSRRTARSCGARGGRSTRRRRFARWACRGCTSARRHPWR